MVAAEIVVPRLNPVVVRSDGGSFLRAQLEDEAGRVGVGVEEGPAPDTVSDAASLGLGFVLRQLIKDVLQRIVHVFRS
jgi:hypothetical protein